MIRAMTQTPSAPKTDAVDSRTATALASRAGWFGKATLDQIGQGVCVTDTRPDLPGPIIEYVNDAYLDIFCCTRDDVIGRDPRFGQGPLTDRGALSRIREHLVSERTVLVQAINYRIDRTPFRLRWSIDPLRDDGDLIGFVALLNDVTVEDRIRRRLTALDTLTSQGRHAVNAPRGERRQALTHALAEAFTPLLDEIGDATVTGGDEPVPTRSVCASAERNPDEVLTVHDDLTVSLSIHPDGVALVDRVAVDELCEHASWLLDLADRS